LRREERRVERVRSPADDEKTREALVTTELARRHLIKPGID
jgi:hypothetical protein